MYLSIPSWIAGLVLTALLACPATFAQDAARNDQPSYAMAISSSDQDPTGTDEGTNASSDRTGSVLALQGVRLIGTLNIDGRLDEAVWEDAPVASSFRQVEPSPGAAASFETDVRILYGSDAIYVGARMRDTSPDSVVARLFRRDANSYSDWFYVQLDSYHDRRTAFTFGVNPRGVQRDYLIYDEVNEDVDWDAVWESKAIIDEQGWTAELRIPLSQLRFRTTETGTQDWGINFLRHIARLDEMDSWSPLSREDTRSVSLFGELKGMEGLGGSAGLEVVPYLASRLERAPADPGNPYYSANDLGMQVGADVRYRLSPGLTLSAAINPDFGQVEADPSEVNLTAFETFLPENRPFFLEGTDVFYTSGPQLFYSRRIGRAPQGYVPSAQYADMPEAATILGASKLTGRAGQWTLGVLSAYTAEENAPFTDANGQEGIAPVEPSTAYVATRARRTSEDGQTAIGGLFTGVQRFGLGSSDVLSLLRQESVAGGLDLTHRFGQGAYQVSASAYGSHVAGSSASIALTQQSAQHSFQRPDASHLTYDPTRTSLSGYSASASLSKLKGTWAYSGSAFAYSPGFEINDLGFLQLADQTGQDMWIGYSASANNSLIRNYELSVYQRAAWTYGGERTATKVAGQGVVTLNSLWSGAIGVEYYPAVLNPWILRGGPALQMAPRAAIGGSVQSDPRHAIQGMVVFQQTNGSNTRYQQSYLRTSAVYRPNTRSSLSLEVPVIIERNPAQYVSQVGYESGTQYLLGEMSQRTIGLTMRAEAAFTPNLSLQFYAQPFISSGRFNRYVAVADPYANRFSERFSPLADRLTFSEEQAAYQVDHNRDGAADYAFRAPDFTVRDLRTNAVLRWQYRPGSTLFFGWSRGQRTFAPDGQFSPISDLGSLLGSPAEDVFMIKLNMWLGL